MDPGVWVEYVWLSLKNTMARGSNKLSHKIDNKLNVFGLKKLVSQQMLLYPKTISQNYKNGMEAVTKHMVKINPYPWLL